MDCTREPLRSLRDDANTFDEPYTKKFWTEVFRRIFPSSSWVIGTEQPPAPYNTLRRVDIVLQAVDGWPHQRHDIHVLIEAKSSKAGRKDIETVEEQCFLAAEEYFLFNGAARGVWAISVFGSNARVWLHKRGSDLLIPAYPPGEYAERDNYVDIANDKHLLRLLKTIRKEPHVTREIIQAVEQANYGESDDDDDDDGDAIIVDEGAPSGTTHPDDTTMGETEEPSTLVDHAKADKDKLRVEEVRVTKVSHFARADEFTFTSQSSGARSTRQTEWKREEWNRSTVWVYKGKKTAYYTRQRLDKL
ncbi:hypothetical protein S40288_11367 [Stachybotrys chartarum IBT 40288]|nr:hypothetical protein S40288_11367 [Stachybotrys chartarum IBT 40288]